MRIAPGKKEASLSPAHKPLKGGGERTVLLATPPHPPTQKEAFVSWHGGLAL